MSSANAPVRWGIVGTGWVSSDFMAPAIVGNKGSRLVACLGSSAEKSAAFAQKFSGVRAHASLAEFMADKEIDAVYVATPNALHPEAVTAAARAGKHVLCEKPFAMKAEEARAMTEACSKAGVVLRVGHQMRMEEALVRARELVLAGRLGRVASITFERASANPPRKTWRTDVSQSGVIFDVAVHLLDQVQWITGQRFVEVSAFTNPDRRDGLPDDQVSVLGRMSEDCHADVRATRQVGTGVNNLVIQGAKATLVTSALRFVPEHTLSILDANGVTQERFPASPAYEWQVAAFESDVRGKPSQLPTGEEASYTVAVTQAVLASVMERRIVKV